ncbi:Flp pilus assembly CpaE family ATPase [Orbus hercynius]|uniref:Flp pilus assembly CpaE family ATPase n=1 Tax=Orbus hercynius TaxID=593135 RepID=A0A495RKH5_9GAMM|nr:hypothetical protein [Orbus hercynius]RKS87859.1 Flp pilus assembly CpaE family ATPase [Orbus hercynius]
MQLFGHSNSKKDSHLLAEPTQEFVVGRISGFSVGIFSERNALIDEIRAILFLYNVLTIEVIPLTLPELTENAAWNKFDIIIFDIEDEDDAEKLSEMVNRCFPIQATTILVGRHDSILFCELLLKKGIHFILEHKQLDKIPTILHTRSITPPGSSKRVGSIVTFLACKGGIGTSSLAVHTIKNISKLTNYPILYIQGASTSPNADFLFEQPIPADGSFTKIDDSLQVKIEKNATAWKYDDLNSGQFNITVIDQNMGLSSSFLHLDDIIELSNMIFVVINRDPYSIRVAKKILEEAERSIAKNTELLNKRFLICLNENVPFDKKSSLQDIDIEDFLGRKVDFIRKFIPHAEKFEKAFTSAEINKISASVIGRHQNLPTKKRRRLFFSSKHKV